MDATRPSLPLLLSTFAANLAAELARSGAESADTTGYAIVGEWSVEITAAHRGSLSNTLPNTTEHPKNTAQTLSTRSTEHLPNTTEQVSRTPRPLPPTALDALEAADGSWRTSGELAGRAGWPYSGHWRGIIARLVGDGLLERRGLLLRRLNSHAQTS